MSDDPQEVNLQQSPRGPDAEPVGVVTDADIYQRLVKEVRDYAIFMLDRDGIIRTWNAGAERLKGYRPEEIIGQHFSRFYSDKDIRAGKPARELDLALADGRLEDEGWRIRKDGSRFWANVVITAIFDVHDRHVGFAKVTRDLTERRAMDEALRVERSELEKRVEERTAALAAANKNLARANQGLEQASRMKDEFLAVLSHELRTPLTAIYGWLSLLLAGKVDQTRLMHVLQIIEKNVRAQSQLVDDLLNVSRIITGNLKIVPQWIDAITVIRSAVESVRPAVTAKDIDVIIEGPESEPIYADPDRLQQVIWNLLTNAVKFSGKRGEIRVTVSRSSSAVQISVSDSGEGIDPEFLPYIFDRFSQADSSTTRKFGGLGLGLSIVRHIMELHGGRVSATSGGLGQGTTMTIQLPIPALLSAGESAPREASSPSLDGLRVMIVEDETSTREMLREALQSYGASVTVAESAGQALKEIVVEKPDLLLSDIGLPNIDGYELLSKIRSEIPELRNIPAVALSAFAGSEHREKSRRAGYLAHIAKPVTVPDLISVLAKVAATR